MNLTPAYNQRRNSGVLRNSLTTFKNAQEVFDELSEQNVNSGLHLNQLFVALSRAMDRNIPHDIVEGTLQDYVIEKQGGQDSNLEMISFIDFIAIMEHTKEKLFALDNMQSMTQEETEELLNKAANDIYPNRKLLCIQMNDEDAKIIKTGPSHHDDEFDAAFAPQEMKVLALVSHNEMKSTMRRMVIANKNILKKFRLTGTSSTITMLREVFADDPDVVFGPPCASGPLGGDAELSALMTQKCLGGIIFFQDPMTAHPHQADIDSLCRLAHVHNIAISNNPTSALMMLYLLRIALQGEGKPALIPSFFFNMVSPSVPKYKNAQREILQGFADHTSVASTCTHALSHRQVAGESYDLSREEQQYQFQHRQQPASITFTRSDASAPITSTVSVRSLSTNVSSLRQTTRTSANSNEDDGLVTNEQLNQVLGKLEDSLKDVISNAITSMPNATTSTSDLDDALAPRQLEVTNTRNAAPDPPAFTTVEVIDASTRYPMTKNESLRSSSETHVTFSESFLSNDNSTHSSGSKPKRRRSFMKKRPSFIKIFKSCRSADFMQ